MPALLWMLCLEFLSILQHSFLLLEVNISGSPVTFIFWCVQSQAAVPCHSRLTNLRTRIGGIFPSLWGSCLTHKNKNKTVKQSHLKLFHFKKLLSTSIHWVKRFWTNLFWSSQPFHKEGITVPRRGRLWSQMYQLLCVFLGILLNLSGAQFSPLSQWEWCYIPCRIIMEVKWDNES